MSEGQRPCFNVLKKVARAMAVCSGVPGSGFLQALCYKSLRSMHCSHVCLVLKSLSNEVLFHILRGDIDSFANHVYAFDNACKLNSWTINILAIIRAVVERKAEQNRQ